MMRSLVIDKEKCQKDGLCMKDCPARLFTRERPDQIPQWIENAEEQCIQCGHCMAICPHGALSVNGIAVDVCPPVTPEKQLDQAQIEYFLRSRRSIRHYQNKAVPPEQIHQLIDMAHYAPTAGNSQQIRWLILSSREEVKRVGQEVINFFKHLLATDHPLKKRYNLEGLIEIWDKGYDPICRKAPCLVFTYAPQSYMTAATDSTITLAYMELAALTLGLGSCWAGFIMRALREWPPMQAMLNLPEDFTAVGAMMVGYPRLTYHRLPQRKPADITIR